MLLLSIDTCGSSGTVALASTEGDKFHLLGQTELAGKTYSAQLVPSMRHLLAARHVAVQDLAAVVVTCGPGSFTGIRIGLATAKGLAESDSIPILAVSRLAVLAHKAHTRAAAFDASRSEFYFRDDSGTNGVESLLTREAFLERAAALSPQLAVCEPSVHALVPAATLVPAPTALDAIDSVLPRFASRDFDDPLLLDGNYIRRSDAEIFSAPGAPARPRQKLHP